MSSSKKTKLGKTRLDKFYHLAKEQGFRSRAAFKLIQLNKKYDFLSTSRATLDLCAAPGSWMQVAAKYMPMSSLIVGIDLDKIKPIKGCIGIEGDITTQKARNDIKKALNSWKVDVCLHDGAPNVGASWILDAYAQAELVLHSLKLATEFLREGGWFVTKIFRSKDYNSLIWVFQQLFKKVEATKPMASRNTSAEIFVVCQGYLDPKHIDPKLLDPRFIFKELDEAAPVVNVFGKQPRRPSRLGYEEGNVTLHKKVDVSDFVDAEDPIKQLGMYNQISFSENSKQYEDHPSTTGEIKELCKDLKVCSKGDFKLLLRWRSGLVEYKKELSGEKIKEEEDEEEEEEEELTLEEQEFRLDQELSERLKELKHKQVKDVKKKKHKESQKRAKVQTLRDMGAVQSGEGANLDISEAGLFELDRIKSDQLLDGIADTDAPDFDENEIQDKKREDQIIAEYEDRVNAVYDDADSDKEDAENNYKLRMEEDFDREFEEKLEKSKNKKDKQILAKSQKKKKKDEEEDKRLDQILTTRKVGNERFIPNVSSDPFGSDSENDERIRKEEGSEEEADSDDSGNDEDEDLDERDFKAPKAKKDKVSKSNKSNSLMVQDTVVAPTISKRADRWFAQDLFKENEVVQPKRKSRIDLSDSEEEEVDTDEEIRNIRASQAKKNKNGKKRKNKNDSDSDDSDEDSFGDQYKNNKKKKEKDVGFEEVKQDTIESDLSDMDEDEKAKVLAIGTLIVNNPHLKRDLVDNAYNRYAFNEDTLPTWFTSEEGNHNVPTLPVTREEIKEMKSKFKELDARPIKKVAEARARKRMKSAKQADQIKQKASMIADSSEMTAGQKTKAIEGLYKELKGRPKLDKKYVVMRSFMKGKVNKGQKEKGKKIKAVDPRMKKDMKRSKQTNRGKGKGKSGYKGKKGPKINNDKKKK